MTHRSRRQTILALLALLAVPGASAQTVSFTDPPGDVTADAAPYSGPGAALVDVLQTSLAVEAAVLRVTIQVASLADSENFAMTGDLFLIVEFSVENGTTSLHRGVRADRAYLTTGGVPDIPPPWSFEFLADAQSADGTPIDGTVDATTGTLEFMVPLELLGDNPNALGSLSSTGQFHARPLSEPHWTDFSEAPGLALNLTLPQTNTTTSGTTPSADGGEEAPGLPWLICLGAVVLAAFRRRNHLDDR